MALRTSLRFGLTAISFWPFLPIASRATTYGRLLIELILDARVPWSRKAVLGMAAAYVLSPIDVVPDRVPLVGRVDDIMVTILALDLFLEGVPRDLMIEKMYVLGIDGRELERDMETVRHLLPSPVRAVARRLPEAIDTAAQLVRSQLAGEGVISTRAPDKEAIRA
jgi:uncharacterized membrane protein YkvA (DUF1232 family)